MDRRRRAPRARTRSRWRAGWREGRPPAALHDRASEELRRARGRPHVRGDRRDGAPARRTVAPRDPHLGHRAGLRSHPDRRRARVRDFDPRPGRHAHRDGVSGWNRRAAGAARSALRGHGRGEPENASRLCRGHSPVDGNPRRARSGVARRDARDLTRTTDAPITIRILLAWLHLLALAVGLAGVWARARALSDSLRNPEDPRAIRRALVGDAWWGIAAVVLLATGLWRLVGGTEKSTSYYSESNAFVVKMALFLVVLALEIWPMTTLMRWRRKRAEPDARDVGRIEIISYVQCALVATIALAAVVTARGYGMRTGATTAVSAERSSDSVVAADSASRAEVAAGDSITD